MPGPESHEGVPDDLTRSMRSAAESGVKMAIEYGLLDEFTRTPETALGFSRVFSSEPPSFGRLFSRGGGTHLKAVTVEALANMEDAAFARFTERLRVLQDLGPSEEAGGPAH